MSQKPSQGRVVIYTLSPFDIETKGFRNNGGATCPATVLRVWSTTDDGASCVNIKLHLDCQPDECATSVRLGPDGEEAKPGEARWPVYVK